MHCKIRFIFFKKSCIASKTRNVCETCIPPKLTFHCDLELWPRNPKFNRGHLLVMTNHNTKLEDPWPISSLVTDWARYAYGPTDWPTYRPTYRRTDICKVIYPHFFEVKSSVAILMSIIVKCWDCSLCYSAWPQTSLFMQENHVQC